MGGEVKEAVCTGINGSCSGGVFGSGRWSQRETLLTTKIRKILFGFFQLFSVRCGILVFCRTRRETEQEREVKD